jgi:hypothetical protein
VSGYASRLTWSVLGCAVIMGGGARPAWAHGFAARYDLPIPLSLYLLGAAAAVAASFLVTVLAGRGAPGGGDRGPDLLRLAPFRWLASGVVAFALRLIGVAILTLIIVAGFIGDQSPIKNIAPVTVWVLWWVGLAYISVLVGNFWAALNPWHSLYDWARRLCGVRRRPAPYPQSLGVWPAVALFAAFAWIELIWSGAERPLNLAWLILAYSVLTWAGMAWFGARAWRDHGEAFSVAFGLFARFAPIVAERPARGPALFRLRPYAVGLLDKEPPSASMAGFILLMLATVTFDGILETPAWLATKSAILSTERIAPFLFWLRDVTGDVHAAVESAGLILFPLLFAGIYLLVCRATARLGGGHGPGLVARRFAPTLVPIAIAYHLAHYLSFFLIAGQAAIPLISDPFGWGWDLFGTAGYRLDVAVIGARGVWFTSVAAIVAGHAIAVYLAHVSALRLFADRRQALRSQYPMLALMVAYTTISLWILSQPVVAG